MAHLKAFFPNLNSKLFSESLQNKISLAGTKTHPQQLQIQQQQIQLQQQLQQQIQQQHDQTDKIVKVFTNVSLVKKYLTSNKFTFVNNEEEAGLNQILKIFIISKFFFLFFLFVLDFIFVDYEFERFEYLQNHQKINQFKNANVLTSKNLLISTIEKKWGLNVNWISETFNLKR